MDAVTVEEHGAGAEARRVMRFGEMALTAFVGAGDDEPRASATDLAAWVEFGRLRDFKKLVSRHEVAGNVRPYWRDTVARQYAGRTGEGVREYAVREAWLSEPDALFIISQCGTPKAVAITKKVIEVFVRVRRGTMPALSGEALAGLVGHAIAGALAPIREELAAVRALAAAQAARPDAGTIGPVQANALLTEFCIIAWLVSGAQRRSKPWLRARTKADNAVRRAVKLPNGRAWLSLPSGLYADALARAKELRADAQRVADERRQPELFARRGAA